MRGLLGLFLPEGLMRTMSMISALATLAVLAGLLFPAMAKAVSRFPDWPEGSSRGVEMIGVRIRALEPGQTLHIVYLHGMRAEGPDQSAEMRSEIVRRYKATQIAHPRRWIELGPRFASAKVADQEVWNRSSDKESEARWRASRPFIDRFEFKLAKGRIVLDELNWWPLLHPLKCQFLVAPDKELSGADKSAIRLCAAMVDQGTVPAGISGSRKGVHYPWIEESEAKRLLTTPARSGKGALINRNLKQEIMNWGVADAPIVLGTMRPLIAKAVDDAFEKIEMPEEPVARIAITESLGSFVLLDAVRTAKTSPARKFLEKTADVFMIANQFALLELARVDFEGTADTPGAASAIKILEELPRPPAPPPSFQKRLDMPVIRQIVAISDPSDVLTYVVPKLENREAPMLVTNIFVPVSNRFIFALPTTAHRGAVTNRGALDLLFASEPLPGPR